MAKAHTSSVRLFVGAFPEGDAARALDALAEQVERACPGWRRTPTGQVHLTLLFIGETDARHVRWITESVERAASGAGVCELTPHRLIALPEHGQARAVALLADAPGVLLEVQRRLAQRLANPERNRRERFLPHLTLCRFRDDGRGSGDRGPLSERLERVWAEWGGSIPSVAISAIRLVSSTMRAGGAQYQDLARVELRG